MRCKLCGAEAHMIHKGTRDNPEVDVYECESCKIKFLDGNYETDYENDYMSKTDNQQDQSPEERLESCRVDDLRRYDQIKDLCKNKDILDFGCGYGGFLLANRGGCRSISGVELGRKERVYLTNNGVDCRKDIEEFENKKFDIITLFHVFEHLDNPREYLKKFARFLKKDGLLIIEVPNANDALLSIYECDAFADFTYWSPHLFLYNEKALMDLLSENGNFEPIDIGFYQRYPLSNHMYWLSNGKPGGHIVWDWMDSYEIDQKYKEKLIEKKACDTLFQIWRCRRE